MTFERTPAGIANRPLFFDVDIVAYHEGVRCGKHSVDHLFWSSIFRIYSSKRVKFIEKGSKSEVIKVFESYKGARNGNSVFLIDRDCDGTFEKFSGEQEIVFTYGYSFENDAVSDFSALAAIINSAPIDNIEREAANLISNSIREMERRLSYVSTVFRIGVQFGEASFTKDRFQKYYVDNRFSAKPVLSAGALISAGDLTREKRRGGNFSIERDWRRNLLGHFFVDFFYRLTVYVRSAIGINPKIRREDFVLSCMSATFSGKTFSHRLDFVQYYEREIGKL